MKYITESISKKLLILNLITNSQLAICNYGIEVLISSIINILTILLCSLFFNTVWHGIIFLIVFVPLRTTLGGYHAKTRIKCFLISMLLYGAISSFQLILNLFLHGLAIWILLLLITTTYILLCKPIENIHHPIKQSIKSKNKTFSLVLMIIDFTVCFMGIVTSPNSSLMQFSILSILAFALLHFISERRGLV